MSCWTLKRYIKNHYNWLNLGYLITTQQESLHHNNWLNLDYLHTTAKTSKHWFNNNQQLYSDGLTTITIATKISLQMAQLVVVLTVAVAVRWEGEIQQHTTHLRGLNHCNFPLSKLPRQPCSDRYATRASAGNYHFIAAFHTCLTQWWCRYCYNRWVYQLTSSHY